MPGPTDQTRGDEAGVVEGRWRGWGSKGVECMRARGDDGRASVRDASGRGWTSGAGDGERGRRAERESDRRRRARQRGKWTGTGGDGRHAVEGDERARGSERRPGVGAARQKSAGPGAAARRVSDRNGRAHERARGRAGGRGKEGGGKEGGGRGGRQRASERDGRSERRGVARTGRLKRALGPRASELASEARRGELEAKTAGGKGRTTGRS